MVDHALRIHVHDDTRVLDGTLRLVELARVQRPIDDTLSSMCQLISEIAAVDVVSIYLREHQSSRDVLVMRGNVGFPSDVVGRVQLGLYEGLTGVVAQRRRPVTVAVAQEDNRYKHVDGIGEEQFAAYLGVPLLVAGDVAGVLVFQRRTPGAFAENDVALASSLTGPLMLVIERWARVNATSFVVTPLVRGRASGHAIVIPPPAPSPVSEAAALHALEFDLVTAAQRVGHAGSGVARALENLSLVAIALRDLVAVGSNKDVLGRLQRVLYHATSGAKDLGVLIAERDREVKDLWSFLVADMQHRLALCGAVLVVVGSLGTFMALEAVARGVGAVVVGRTAEPVARQILEAANVPAVVASDDVLERIRCGVRVEIDGGRGTIRLLGAALPGK